MQGLQFIKMAAIGFAMLVGTLGGAVSWAQTGPDATVRTMQITGEIAKSGQQYIIRGKVPAEIFTILNPYPNQLAKYMGDGKMAVMDVRIVSGDNVEIEKIDGNTYSQDSNK
jgi:hypothetical protein